MVNIPFPRAALVAPRVLLSALGFLLPSGAYRDFHSEPSLQPCPLLAVPECQEGWTGELSAPWQNLLENRHIYTAALLTTEYSDTGVGGDMEIGENTMVESPDPLVVPDSKQRTVQLTHRFGHGEKTSVLLWKDVDDESLVYVSFTHARSFRQLFDILLSRGGIPYTESWGDKVSVDLDDVGDILLNKYLSKQLSNIWPELKAVLKSTYASTPTLMFTGLSWGATLAQAAALRFRLEEPTREVRAVTWNAFKWTDGRGARLLERILGKDRLLPFAMVAHFHGNLAVDPIVGFPMSRKKDWQSAPGLILQDKNTGCMKPSDEVEGFRDRFKTYVRGALSRIFRFKWLVDELHVTTPVLQASYLSLARFMGLPEPLELPDHCDRDDMS